MNIFHLLIYLLIFGVAYPAGIKAHGWKAPTEAAERVNPISKDPSSIRRGKKLFIQHCATCHGNNGEGDGPLSSALKTKPANLKKRSGHHSDGDFAWKIANGRGLMPGFKDHLTKEQIWDLTNFIQSLKTKNVTFNMFR